jgi:hypothetical protein
MQEGDSHPTHTVGPKPPLPSGDCPHWHDYDANDP